MKNIPGGINVISRKTHFLFGFLFCTPQFSNSPYQCVGIISFITGLVGNMVLQWGNETNMWFELLRGCLHGGRKIQEGGTTFRLVYMHYRPLAVERPAAAMFVLFIPCTRIFRAKVVYMVLGSSYLSARKILSLGKS